jgi:hypothetical protein
MGGEVKTLTITKAHMGTQPATYHLQVSMARVKVKRTYRTSFAIETHTTGSRTTAKSEIVPSANATMTWTMIIMNPTMTNLTDTILRLEDAMKGGSSPFLVI